MWQKTIWRQLTITLFYFILQSDPAIKKLMNIKFLRAGLVVLVASLFASILLFGKLDFFSKLTTKAYPSYCPDACSQAGVTKTVTSQASVGRCWVAQCRATGDSTCPQYGWYIDHYISCPISSPPSGPVSCATPTNPCSSGSYCRKWVCPYGDTNHDGKCQTGDTGATYTDYTDCSGISCGSQCCQIDWLNSAGGGYCTQANNCKEIKLNCATSGPSSRPTPTVTPTPTATPTYTPTSTPVVTPTPTETPTPTSTPNYCNGTCGSNYNCQGGYYCYNGYCRNPSCPDDSGCGCGATSTPSPTPPPVLGATAPPVLPNTGSNDWAFILGFIGIGAVGLAIFKRFKLI